VPNLRRMWKRLDIKMDELETAIAIDEQTLHAMASEAGKQLDREITDCKVKGEFIEPRKKIGYSFWDGETRLASSVPHGAKLIVECQYCGRKNKDDSETCNGCGAAL